MWPDICRRRRSSDARLENSEACSQFADHIELLKAVKTVALTVAMVRPMARPRFLSSWGIGEATP